MAKLVFLFIEVAFSGLAMYFVLSQIVLPAMFGTKLFPFFSKERELKEEILEAQQEIHEKDLAHIRDELKSRLEEPEPVKPETKPES